jgi:hypothetical protein
MVVKFWKDELARGFRRLLEERVYGDHGIAFNDESFLLGSGFTLSALRLWFLRHPVLLSQRFLSVALVKMVPQPGIGPGRPEWARGCKPRLSASSSTGAHCKKAKNAGAVMPAKTSPVPALFGPINAALTPSSFSVLRQNSCNRSLSLTLFRFLCGLLCYRFIQPHHLLSGPYSGLLYSLYASSGHSGQPFHGDQIPPSNLTRETRGFFSQCSLYGRNPFVADNLAVVGFYRLYLTLLKKSFQAIVNRRERLAVFREIKSEIQQAVAYFRGGKSSVLVSLEHHANAISEPHCLSSGFAFHESRDLDIGRVFLVFVSADGSQAIDQLFPLNNLRVNCRALFVDFRTCGGKFIEFLSCDH